MNHKINRWAALALAFGVLAAQPLQALEFGAFGNVNLTKKEGNPTSFALGGFDLFARQDISDKSSALVEYVIESGDGTSFILDLERLVVDYDVTPSLTLSAGRIHSQVGYWNATYHHGQLLQPTISRPEFIQFEDGSGSVIPVHLIGLFADGELASSAGVFQYHLAWANNPQVDTGIAVAQREILLTMSGDTTNGKTLAGKIDFEPNNVPLQLGLYVQKGAYNDLVGTRLIDQTVVTIDARVEFMGADLLAEYYNISNDDIAGATGAHDIMAYFVQVAYTVNEVWTPVYRYEKSDTDLADPFANGGIFQRDDYNKWVLALRYDLDESNAITLEASSEDVAVGADHNAIKLQWAFMLF